MELSSTFVELSSKSLFLSLDKEKRCLVLTFSMKCEIRNFHVVVCHDRKEMYQKIKLDGHAKLLFCYSNLIAFFRSRCRRRRRCLSSLLNLITKIVRAP